MKPPAQHDGHGGHGWLMIVCCIPMLVLAVVLLSEPLSAWQAGGGLLIGAGILLAGSRGTVAAPAE